MNDNDTIFINEQNGTRFAGKIISAENLKQVEAIIGVIDTDNKSLNIVDENDLMWGELLSPTEMDVTFQSVGMDSIAVWSGIFTKQ